MIFIAFIFALLVLTMPLWVGSLPPYFSRYLQSVAEAARGLIEGMGK